MLNVPAALWPYLLSKEFRPVEVYEIEAFAGRSILRYSSQDITWGGNAYTGLAVERSSIKQAMEFRIPDCTLTFSNVQNTLRAHLTPTDTLTGARLTVRLVMRDSGGSVMTDSVVIFRGRIEPPKQISETEFQLSAVGILDGAGVEAPTRRLAVWCGWQYANLGAFDGNGHCSYQYNAKASGAGAASTALTLGSTTAVGAGTNSKALTTAAASNFKNGDWIKIGTNDPVTIIGGGGTTSLVLLNECTWTNGQAVVPYIADGSSIQIGGGAAVTVNSGGGTASLTLSAARTWSNLDTVRHADCPNRSRGECEARGMLHRFGGHPGVAGTARTGRKQLYFRHTRTGDVIVGGTGFGSPLKMTGDAGTPFAAPDKPVAALYGRRRFSPRIIEKSTTQSAYNVKTQATSFHSLSVGEIDSVVRYWLEDKLGVDQFGYIGWVSGDKTWGIYYRPGSVGVADEESVAEYVSDKTTQLRSQNIDYRSFAQIAYSEEAYLILIQATGSARDESMLTVDVKGIKIQKYDAAGATSGGLVWSESPIWQAVDWTAKDYGLGLTASDIDFAVTKPEADYGEVLITGTEASTTVTVAAGSATKTCWVKSTEGLICGRRVDVNGVANTVESIQTDTKFTLGTAVTQSVGHTVLQRPQRFESHLYIDNVDRGTNWLKAILASCRGYVTYDNGKVQFRIERNHVIERLSDGGFETWASSTDLTAGTETISASNTINREASIIHGGTYSLKLHRGASGNLNERVTLGTIEPGRWYRIAGYDYGGSAGLTNAAQIRIYNATTAKYLNADGITWQAGSTAAITNTPANGAWTQRELTFLADPAGASTDTVYVYFVHNETTPVNGDVYFDDFSLRGPYAGDFRETTTANVMGWKAGSFRWSIDKKDRETNRVSVRFNNESGYFGDDEAVANDFTHQQTHPVKTKNIDAPSICDRDQAMRLAKLILAKLRTLGPGCEFVASPAGLALQPGDVLLVSHTVPSWTCKEQRVTELETIGMPEDDEHFTRVRTEEYLESIYQDGGAVQFTFPPQTEAAVLVTVARNAGGVLDLTFDLSDPTYAVASWEIYMSDTTGFTPDASTLIGSSTSSRFTYTAQVDELDVLRYFVVIAVTDRGELVSSEFSTTIFRAEPPVTGGYSNNFQYPTTIQSVDPGIGTNAYVNETAGAATVAKINDASDSTYLTGFSSATAGVKDGNDSSIRYHSFGAGTGKTGRPYVRGNRVVTGPTAYSHVRYYYTLDRTAGSPTWVLWQEVTSDVIADYYGPELTGVDYSKLSIRCRTYSDNGGLLDRDVTDFNYTVAFDEKA